MLHSLRRSLLRCSSSVEVVLLCMIVGSTMNDNMEASVEVLLDKRQSTIFT